MATVFKLWSSLCHTGTTIQFVCVCMCVVCSWAKQKQSKLSPGPLETFLCVWDSEMLNINELFKVGFQATFASLYFSRSTTK